MKGAEPAGTALLSVEALDVGYGQGRICQRVTLDIGPGEAVSLLGRNGVGKTTLLRGILCLGVVHTGRCRFDGCDISRLSTPAIARRGIGYVPQGRELFPDLSVRDNLRMGTVIHRGRPGPIPRQVFDFFPILKERLDQRAGTLSGGEQQMAAIARALAGEPRLLLLDEPTEGIQPTIVQHLREVLQYIRAEAGLSLLVVEQNLDFALAVTTRGYVMEKGRIVARGTTEELRGEDVVRAYLGV
jgi:urea transport system ATP-binding protein